MEPKWEVELIFIAIENETNKIMPFRQGVEGLGLAGAWAQARGHGSIGGGCPSTKRRFAENRRQGCSILRSEFSRARYILYTGYQQLRMRATNAQTRLSPCA